MLDVNASRPGCWHPIYISMVFANIAGFAVTAQTACIDHAATETADEVSSPLKMLAFRRHRPPKMLTVQMPLAYVAYIVHTIINTGHDEYNINGYGRQAFVDTLNINAAAYCRITSASISLMMASILMTLCVFYRCFYECSHDFDCELLTNSVAYY